MFDQSSYGSHGGRLGVVTWAGFTNVTFACTTRCASGAYTVSVAWNLTWKATVGSNCTAYYPNITTSWARLNLTVDTTVYDVSLASPVLVGNGTLEIYRAHFPGTPSWPPANASRMYVQRLNLSLTAGHTYALTSYVYLETLVHSLNGCGSSSGGSIAIRGSGASELKDIRIY